MGRYKGAPDITPGQWARDTQVEEEPLLPRETSQNDFAAGQISGLL